MVMAGQVWPPWMSLMAVGWEVNVCQVHAVAGCDLTSYTVVSTAYACFDYCRAYSGCTYSVLLDNGSC
jgi:hypothetical protein